MPFGVVGAAEAQQESAQVAVRLGVLGVMAQRLAVERERVVEALLALELRPAFEEALLLRRELGSS